MCDTLGPITLVTRGTSGGVLAHSPESTCLSVRFLSVGPCNQKGSIDSCTAKSTGRLVASQSDPGVSMRSSWFLPLFLRPICCLCQQDSGAEMFPQQFQSYSGPCCLWGPERERLPLKSIPSPENRLRINLLESRACASASHSAQGRGTVEVHQARA